MTIWPKLVTSCQPSDVCMTSSSLSIKVQVNIRLSFLRDFIGTGLFIMRYGYNLRILFLVVGKKSYWSYILRNYMKNIFKNGILFLSSTNVRGWLRSQRWLLITGIRLISKIGTRLRSQLSFRSHWMEDSLIIWMSLCSRLGSIMLGRSMLELDSQLIITFIIKRR